MWDRTFVRKEEVELENKKIKICRYLVRGRRREFQVLVFPRTSHLKAYLDWDDDAYEIDGDLEGYQAVKHALAILAADPEKIIYFPLREKSAVSLYQENYDAVLTRPELQFDRAEWITLRRQLNPAHQVQGYILRYEPKKLMDQWERFQGTDADYRVRNHRSKQDVRTLHGDTAFFSLLKPTCLSYFHRIFTSELDGYLSQLTDCFPVWGGYRFAPLGWIIADKVWQKDKASLPD